MVDEFTRINVDGVEVFVKKDGSIYKRLLTYPLKCSVSENGGRKKRYLNHDTAYLGSVWLNLLADEVTVDGRFNTDLKVSFYDKTSGINASIRLPIGIICLMVDMRRKIPNIEPVTNLIQKALYDVRKAKEEGKRKLTITSKYKYLLEHGARGVTTEAFERTLRDIEEKKNLRNQKEIHWSSVKNFC